MTCTCCSLVTVPSAPSGLQALEHAARDVQRGREGLRVAHREQHVRRVEQDAVDRQATARRVDERRAGDDADGAELHRLGAGVPQLLHRVEHRRGVHLRAGVGDDQPDAGAARRPGAGQDGERVQPGLGRLEGGLRAVRAGLQPLLGRLQLPGLVLEPRLALVDVVQDVHQVVLAQGGQALLPGLPHLGHHGEAEQQGEERRQRLGPGGPRPAGPPQPAPGRARVGLPAAGPGGEPAWCVLMRGTGGGGWPRRWRRSGSRGRRRRPSTAGSRRPAGHRGRRSGAATTTLDRKDTTKTLSSKIPSRMARTPPNTASSAATTAIGR